MMRSILTLHQEMKKKKVKRGQKMLARKFEN